MTRLIDVTKEEVESAWMQVRSAGGCAGWDEITIDDVEKDLDNQLYKIWNRMSSGSYMGANDGALAPAKRRSRFE